MKTKSEIFSELLGAIYKLILFMAFTVTALVQLFHGNYFEASALLVAGCFLMSGVK